MRTDPPDFFETVTIPADAPLTVLEGPDPRWIGREVRVAELRDDDVALLLGRVVNKHPANFAATVNMLWKEEADGQGHATWFGFSAHQIVGITFWSPNGFHLRCSLNRIQRHARVAPSASTEDQKADAARAPWPLRLPPPRVPTHAPERWPPTRQYGPSTLDLSPERTSVRWEMDLSRLEIDFLLSATDELRRVTEIHWVTDRLQVWTEKVGGLWRTFGVSPAGEVALWSSLNTDWPSSMFQSFSEPGFGLSDLLGYSPPGGNFYAYTPEAAPPRVEGKWLEDYQFLVHIGLKSQAGIEQGPTLLWEQLERCRKALGLSRGDFARRFGWKHIHHGVRALEDVFWGKIHPRIEANAASVLGCSERQVGIIIGWTRRYFEALAERERIAKQAAYQRGSAI